jgi:hypothetical protein
MSLVTERGLPSAGQRQPFIFIWHIAWISRKTRERHATDFLTTAENRRETVENRHGMSVAEETNC